ncbi:uncharacterized protein [Enoplosus armatus]|uniref:uncharacterized protein n=1 Tax=Enoplosus armatus TaxID=215367 RepID=UPI0039944768
MPAEVLLSTWTVSQGPTSISLKRVNSSVEITCSTSLSDPMGFSLRRRFHGEGDVVFLALDNGQITKDTIATEFVGRIRIAPDQQTREGYGFTLQLSLLRLEDTDLYDCSWIRFQSEKAIRQTMSSTGTIIIVRDRDPQEQCKHHVLDHIFIALSVTAFTVLLLFIGALIVRRNRFKRHFRPAGAVKPPRPNRAQPVCPQHSPQHCPYMTTSVNRLDFRGIL